MNANAVAAVRPTDNLDTFDPERERIYNAYSFTFQARPGRGAQLFGGFGCERQLDVNCTAPDNPNSLRFCDDRVNDIPFKKGIKLAGSYPLAYGITVSAVLQSNESPSATTAATSRNMTITRGTTRYPATCPAPCPAGAIIGPAAIQNQTSLVIALEPFNHSFTERITQFDFKIAKTFRFNRVTVSPVFEMFNVNNTDAIISYQSLSILSAQYQAPNCIMQPRMIGVGAQVRW